MNKLGRILLDRLVLLRVEFLPEGGWRTTSFVLRRGVLTPAAEDDARKYPAVVVCCGQGVVAKPADSEIAARVRRDAGTFLWSESQGVVSFVRRAQLGPLQDEMAGQGIVPVLTVCADAGSDFDAVAAGTAEHYYGSLRWRDLLRPAPETSSAAQALVRRLALPLLGTLLVLLGANAFWSSSLAARRATLQAALDAREKDEARTEAADGRRQQLLGAFAARPAASYAVLCDRIAAALPDDTALTLLEVEPLVKRFEAGKPLLRREGYAVVCGVAADPGSVARFADGLVAERFNAVRLLSVEKEREGTRLVFRIEIKL